MVKKNNNNKIYENRWYKLGGSIRYLHGYGDSGVVYSTKAQYKKGKKTYSMSIDEIEWFKKARELKNYKVS